MPDRSDAALKAAILFEDNHILIVNKQSGIPVQGDKTGDTPLVELYRDLRERVENKPGKAYLVPVHRLDRPVSGVTVLAKTSKAAGRLGNCFREGDTNKKYLCWLQPKNMERIQPIEDTGTLEDWILKKPSGTSLIVKPNTQNSKHSHLRYEVLKRGKKRILVAVDLGTGRHHQIRVQFASRDWVIVGDKRYGAPRAIPDRSIALHAQSLALPHPVSKEIVEFVAALPETWREWGPKTGR